MSTLSEKARETAREKAERFVRVDPQVRTDASGYRPEGALNADVATGLRPISRRAYRRGGKVHGDTTAPRADRKPRASGGPLTANSLVNRNVKAANEERDGLKFTGGLKRGGHVDEAQDRKLIHKMGCQCRKCAGGRVERRDGGRSEYTANQGLAKALAPAVQKPAPPPMRISPGQGGDPYNSAMRYSGKRARGGPAIKDGTRPVGGRLARKGGGRTKGKTNVNIIITPQGGSPPAIPPPQALPPDGPVGLHQGIPPSPPPGAPAGGPSPGGMPLMRASGGRAGFSGKLARPGRYPISTGAGGGLGRLEKAAKAARS